MVSDTGEAFASRLRAAALASWCCLKCHTLKWRDFPCRACGFPLKRDSNQRMS